jgi:hypothetical protein
MLRGGFARGSASAWIAVFAAQAIAYELSLEDAARGVASLEVGAGEWINVYKFGGSPPAVRARHEAEQNSANIVDPNKRPYRAEASLLRHRFGLG